MATAVVASSAPTDCLAITAGNSNEHANEYLEAANEDPDAANEDSEAYLLLSILMSDHARIYVYR